MSKTKFEKLKQTARLMNTHVVVFTSGSEEELCAIKAQAGKTTRQIALETGLTAAQVQYRILKAQRVCKVQFRKEYRNGGGFSAIAEQAIRVSAAHRIQQQVFPVFSRA